MLGVTAVCPHLGFISLEAISFDTPSSLSVTPPPRLVSWSKNQTTEERGERIVAADNLSARWRRYWRCSRRKSRRDAHAHARSLSSSRPRALEELLAQRRPQTGVLRPLDGQPVDCVVVDHLRDGVEGSGELAQDVLTPACQLDPHVHEPVAAPRKMLDIMDLLNGIV